MEGAMIEACNATRALSPVDHFERNGAGIIGLDPENELVLPGILPTYIVVNFVGGLNSRGINFYFGRSGRHIAIE